MVEPPKRDSSDFSFNDSGESKRNTSKSPGRIRKKLAGEQDDKTEEERVVSISNIEQQQKTPESLLRKKSVREDISDNAPLAGKVAAVREARALLSMPSDKRLKMNIVNLDVRAMLSFGARNQANAGVVLEELLQSHPTLLEGVREEGVPAILAAKKNYTIEYTRGCLALLNALKDSNPALRNCLTLEEALNRPDLIAQITSLTVHNPDEESRVFRKGCGRPMVLPQEIGKFLSLKDLIICGCNVTELPALLGDECRALEILNVSSNKLTRLPASIGKCQALKEINANFNALTHLPPELGLCKDLEKILVSYNNLEEIPDEVKMCEKLTNIFLAKNNFTEEYVNGLALLLPGVKIESK